MSHNGRLAETHVTQRQDHRHTCVTQRNRDRGPAPLDYQLCQDQDRMIEYVMVIEGFYILHFNGEVDFPKWSMYGDGKHYVGISRDIYRRLDRHRDEDLKNGAGMTRAAREQGITFANGRIYACPYSPAIEKAITKHSGRLCKRCHDDEDRQLALIKVLVDRSVRTGHRV